jgi:dTDP-4-amino-4,6-dideoxygalactose transaminase
MIAYGKQHISEDDIAAVVAVLRSDFLTQGPMIAQFEQALAEKIQAKHTVAVSNGTAALHVACLSLDLAPGKRLWTTVNTFVASAACGIYCGAAIDLIDIHPDTHNIDINFLTEKLAQAAGQNQLPDVIVAVHFAGLPCDMEKLYQLKQQYGFALIEDASHALGASYHQQPIGNCHYSDLTTFSFHPVKIITCGEGGAIACNDEQKTQRLKRLRQHGIELQHAPLPGSQTLRPYFYQHLEFGFNYRLTDFQAALALSQLTRLDQWVSQRQALADAYDLRLKHLPIKRPYQSTQQKSAWHLYVIELLDANMTQRDQILGYLRELQIQAHVHYIPLHFHPSFQKLGFKVGDFPNSELYYQRCLSLPLHPGIDSEQQDWIIHALERAIELFL